MEFEKALFRVHERTLGCLVQEINTETGVRSNSPAYKCCKVLQKIVAVVFGILFAFFLFVHFKYLNYGTCFEDALLKTLAELPAQLDNNNNNNQISTNITNNNNTNIHNKSTIPNRHGSIIFDDDILLVEIAPSLSSYDKTKFKPEYEFSATASLLYLTKNQRKQHKFRELNVTIDGACIGAYSVARLAGMDTVIINQIMYGLDSNGLIRNYETGELWSWSNYQVTRNKHSKFSYNFFSWIADRFLVLIWTFLCFGLMSGITAVIIRVLVSSGVVLIFPLFFALRRAGLRNLDMNLVVMSYPWLGVEVGQLLRSRQRITSYICAHLMYLVTLYLVFELSQISWSTIIYNKSYPAGLPLVVASGLMVLEYFSLVYIRSLSALQYFPKFIFINFLLFHIYFYSTSYGFYYLAITLCILATTYVMLWFLTDVEVKALESGMICSDVPRAKFISSRIPSWVGALSPLVTIFHFVGEAHFPITYEDVVEGGGGNNNNNNADFYQLQQEDGNDGNINENGEEEEEWSGRNDEEEKNDDESEEDEEQENSLV